MFSGYEESMSVGEFREFKDALKAFKLKPADAVIEAKRDTMTAPNELSNRVK